MGFLGDVFLEDFGFCCLGVAEIHHFVQEFIDYDKVVTNGFFFQFFKVFDHDLYYQSRTGNGTVPRRFCGERGGFRRHLSFVSSGPGGIDYCAVCIDTMC